MTHIHVWQNQLLPLSRDAEARLRISKLQRRKAWQLAAQRRRAEREAELEADVDQQLGELRSAQLGPAPPADRPGR